jgi:hypothetical protein
MCVGDQIPTELVIIIFKKCENSNSLEVYEDNLLWDKITSYSNNSSTEAHK